MVLLHPARLALAIATLALITFGPVLVARGASDPSQPGPTGQTPSWSVNLHTLGFGLDEERPSTLFGNRSPYLQSRFDDHAIAFTSTGQVGLIFWTFSTTSSGGYVPGTGTTYLISIDGATGKVIATKQWPWRPDQSGATSITATPSGKFLLQGDSQLFLYSPSLQLINSVQLGERVEGHYPSFSYAVSTDGHYVFVQTKKNNTYTVSMLNSETLQPIRTSPSDFPIAAISEHYFARWQELKDVYRRSLYVQSKGTEWKEIYHDTGCNEVAGSANFLTDTVLLVRSCDKLTVMDIDGNVLFSNTAMSQQELGAFGASSDGQRFAVSIAELKKQPWWFGDPGYDRVHSNMILYDVARHQAVSTFTLYQDYERPFRFALSEDGSQLALLRIGVLELYRIKGKD